MATSPPRILGEPSIMPFAKYHGAGNDYILVDAVSAPERLELAEALAKPISDRHRGIGGDGLIVLSSTPDADFRMHMWNADGSRGALCGNGLRCLARFTHDLGFTESERFRIASDSGVHEVQLLRSDDGSINAVRITIDLISIDTEPVAIEIDGSVHQFITGSAGNPHAVLFTSADPESFDLPRIGMVLQSSARFPDGVNVEIVQAHHSDVLVQRTFERGSGETEACGSGATFAVGAAIALGHVQGPTVTVRLRGGNLRITKHADKFSLEGPVARVFVGEFPIGTAFA